MPCNKQHPLRPPRREREHALRNCEPERLGGLPVSAARQGPWRFPLVSPRTFDGDVCGTFRESSRFKTSSEIEVNPMRKLVTALAAATIVAAGVATPTTADARWRGGWWGPALGGFAVGAIVGSAFARPYYAYPYYGYGYGPYYGYAYPSYYGYAYSYPPYYGYGDRPYFGYYGARY